jgi:serine/threonine protein kinase
MQRHNDDQSLGGDATFNGDGQRRLEQAQVSLGGEQTVGPQASARIETINDDIEIIDLDARDKIQAALGRGGMGEVILALDTRLDRKVAIKRILGDAAQNKSAVSRFLTEAKAIAALNHPNIVQIYDYGRAKDGPFLIMEYVDGESLLDRCRAGALPLDHAIDLACQLCDGLAKAHEQGIIHRDIKPANVLLTKDGLPKLTDFGLAKAEAADQQMTIAGAVLGTPDFMPPEQRRDASLVDARSDVWSMAATIYQMVTGRSPKIIRFNDVPESLHHVLAKALEEDKIARYQSIREFRLALRKVIDGAGKVESRAGSPTDHQLEEGQCKSCGTITSDLTKKFCRNPTCGAPLRVACMQCGSQIPVWDGVCGECGANQPQMLAAKEEREKRKAEAAAEAAASLRAHYLDNLEARIVSAVKEAKADRVVTFNEVMGILALANEYLSDNPQNEKIQSLVKQCHRLAPPLLTNSVGMKLKFVNAGHSFIMGAESDARPDQRPHKVRLSQPFYIGIHQVTNAHWRQVMGRVPSRGKDDEWPVEQVSWHDAIEFCRTLSELPAERRAGRIYRLPTEAEWEFACLAGTTTAYSFGNDESLLPDHAWFEENSGGHAHPVGKKKPNAWGIFDMHGNVCEWCSDWYADYPDESVTDPSGPADGTDRVLRGGGWDNDAQWCTAAWRNALNPSDSGEGLGFRVALGRTHPVPADGNGHVIGSGPE